MICLSFTILFIGCSSKNSTEDSNLCKCPDGTELTIAGGVKVSQDYCKNACEQRKKFDEMFELCECTDGNKITVRREWGYNCDQLCENKDLFIEASCRQYTDESKYECFIKFVSEYEDCDQIILDFEKEPFYNKKEADQLKSKCMVNVIKQKNDLEKCKEFTDNSYLDCLKNFYNILKEESYCLEIPKRTSFNANGCFLNLAINLKDPSYCEKLEGEPDDLMIHEKANCKAKALNDPSLCSEHFLLPSCYFYFAKKNLDKELCYKMDNRFEMYSNCFYYIATEKKDPILCEEIIDNTPELKRLKRRCIENSK
jgi:hypothetical protein